MLDERKEKFLIMKSYMLIINPRQERNKSQRSAHDVGFLGSFPSRAEISSFLSVSGISIQEFGTDRI